MKKISALLVGAVLSLSVVACAACGEPKSELTLKSGVLQIGMEVGYPPFEYEGENGYEGYDVDLANALGEELGLKIEFINTDWDGIFQGLKISKYDCIISAVTINAERMEEMLFSDPYIDNYQSIVVKKGSGITASSFASLNGLVVGYQSGTTSADIVADLVDSAEVTLGNSEQYGNGYAKILNCFTDLDNGNINSILCDSTVADNYVASYPDRYEEVWRDEENGEQFGVAIRMDNTALQEAINDALDSIKAKGTLNWIKK